MTNQREAQSDALQAVLEALCLSEKEEQAAREFFSGQAGEEVLAGFEFRDLAETPSEPSRKLFRELMKKKKHEEIKRLFLLLFAKGQATCLWMLPDDLSSLMRELGDVDGVKRAVICAANIGMGLWHINARLLREILEMADHNPETLKRALEYEKNIFINGKQVLLALYFFAKYGERTGMGSLKMSGTSTVVSMEQKDKPESEEVSGEGKDKPESEEVSGKRKDKPESEEVSGEQKDKPESGEGFGKQKNKPEGGKDGSSQENEHGIEMDKEDQRLLSLHEQFAVECLAALHFRNPANPNYRSLKVYMQEDPEVSEKLMVAVSGDGFEEVRKGIQGVGIGNSWALLRLTAAISFLNYKLSDKLRNIVRLCVAAGTEKTLDILWGVSSGTPFDIGKAKEAYDQIFSIDGERYIRWALEKERTDILKRQIVENTETYLFVMGKMGLKEANRMLALIKEQLPELHRKILAQRSSNGENEDKKRVIAGVVKESRNPELASAYLRGECGTEVLFAQNWLDGKKHYYAGGYARDFVDGYLSNYEEPEFFRRCMVYMLVSHGGYFFRRDVTHSASCRESADAEGVKRIFEGFEAEGVPIPMQVSAISLIHETLLHEEGQQSFLAEAAKVFYGYLEEEGRREETLKAFAEADAVGRYCGLKVLQKDAGKNQKEIFAYLQDGAKMVKQELFDILCRERDWEEEVKELLLSKRAADREIAIKVLLVWRESGADYRKVFRQALEKEKNTKVKELLRDALEGADGETEDVPETSREELVKELHSGGKKRGLAWAYETPFPAVHTVDGNVAEEAYLQAVLLCYSSQGSASGSGIGRSATSTSGSGTGGNATSVSGSGMDGKAVSASRNGTGGNVGASSGYGLSRNAAFLAENLNAAEFAVYVGELFDKWLAAGADTKKRWVLYAAAIHGGNPMIEKLKQQIKDWPQQGRSAIACEAVKALSLSPLPQALLEVDGMARKFKSRQVRLAAGDALNFAAAQLNLTREELADCIVPDFGFDEKMERRFDYGARSFLVAITPELELEVFEAEREEGESVSAEKFSRGKKLKTLPAPGKKDDETVAAAAYAEFKRMKKQLKITVTSQRQRLEQALATARAWGIPAWERLFVKNPVMRPFATGLIWGIYEKDRLVQGFRYMEDGSLNTEDEEEYTLPANGKIRLVHPMELSEEAKAAWGQQLEDYEIAQPIEQLNRKVYAVDEEEAALQEMIRFYDRNVNGAVLNSRLLDFGWYQAPVEDAGRFFAYYREDAGAGLAARLDFSGNYTSGGNEEVTVYGVRFYRTGADGNGVNMRGVVDESKACLLKDVPARYFSEVVWQVTKAAGI